MGIVIRPPETLGDLISSVAPQWGVIVIGLLFSILVGVFFFFLIRNKKIDSYKRKIFLILMGGACPLVGFGLTFLVWWIPASILGF